MAGMTDLRLFDVLGLVADTTPSPALVAGVAHK
jgi:hypothetical protein